MLFPRYTAPLSCNECIPSTKSYQSPCKLFGSLKTLVAYVCPPAVAITENRNFFLRFQESWHVVARVRAHAVQLDVGSVVGADTIDFFQTTRVARKYRRRRRFVHFFKICVRLCVCVFLFFKEITTQCCFFMIIHTFGLSLSISSFAYRAPRYTKVLVMVSRSVSLIFFLWLMLMMNFNAKLTTSTHPKA